MSRDNRPVIGITSSMSDTFIKMRRNDVDAVLGAGGIPVFMPHNGGKEDAKKFLEFCDGVLFAGGDDVDPKHYGEEIAFDNVQTTPLRDDFELALAELLKNDSRPILGICRGEQLLNVAFGGSLYQHIDGHRQEEKGAVNLRTAKILEGSFLHEIVGEIEVKTNSFHHQAVKDIGPGLIITARASDGMIEGFEKPDHPYFVAVQWHPERLVEGPHHPEHKPLFKSFVDACRK